MKTKKRIIKIGNMTIVFDSEMYNGEPMDTIVSINGSDIMTIAGTDINDVLKVIKCLNDYRI